MISPRPPRPRWPLGGHSAWAILTELFFFLAVLAVATSLSHDPTMLHSQAVRAFLKRLDQTFMPFAAIKPWYALAFAIFLHNARAFLLIAFAAALAAALAGMRGTRTLGAALTALTVGGSAMFWLLNATAAGVVVAAVASTAGVPPLLVWLSLLPHGLFELFALSWAMVLPVRLAWDWLSGENGAAAALALRQTLWPGVVAVLGVLALAATIEATVSPRVLHTLVPTAHRSLTRTAARL